MGLTKKQRELKAKRVLHKILGEPIEPGDIVTVQYYGGPRRVSAVVDRRTTMGFYALREIDEDVEIGVRQYFRNVKFSKSDLRKVFK